MQTLPAVFPSSVHRGDRSGRRHLILEGHVFVSPKLKCLAVRIAAEGLGGEGDSYVTIRCRRMKTVGTVRSEREVGYASSVER